MTIDYQLVEVGFKANFKVGFKGIDRLGTSFRPHRLGLISNLAKITFIQDYAPTEEGERYNQGCLLQPAPRLFSSHSVARSPVNG